MFIQLRHSQWAVLLAAVCISCASSAQTAPDNLLAEAGVSLVLPEARNAEYSKSPNPSVTYELAEAHPAEAARKEFDTRLRNAGWTPLTQDVFNPGAKSVMRRWGIAVVRDEPQFRWVEQWTRRDGSVISISLTYRAQLNEGRAVAVGPAGVYIVFVSKERMEILKKIP